MAALDVDFLGATRRLLWLNAKQEDPFLLLPMEDTRSTASKERASFERNCSSAPYRQYKLLVSLFSRLIGIELVHDCQVPALTNSLISMLCRYGDEEAKCHQCRVEARKRKVPRYSSLQNIVAVICSGVAMYIAIKFILSTFVLFQVDKLAIKMKSKIPRATDSFWARVSASNSTSSIENCLKFDDIVQGDKGKVLGILSNYSTLVPWDARLGLSFWSKPVVGMIVLTCWWSAPVAFLLKPQICLREWKRKFRVDVLGFLFQPDIESFRIRLDIGSIISGLRNEERPICGPPPTRAPPGEERTKPPPEPSSREAFIRILDKIQQQQLVRPFCIHPKLHADLVCSARAAIFIILALSLSIPMVIILAVMLSDTWIRVQETTDCNGTYYSAANGHCRAEMLGDKQSLEQADLLLNKFYLVSLLPKKLMAANLDFGPGPSGGEAAFWYSFTSHIGGYKIVVLECVTIITMHDCMFTFWFNVYILSNIYKLNWIWQLQNQLRHCRECSDSLAFGDWPDGAQTDDLQRAEERRRRVGQLLEYLTIAYINYELFWRQRAPFKRLTSHQIVQVACISFAVSTTIYFAIGDLQNRSPYQIIMLTFFVLLLTDVYLLLACFTSKSFENLAKQMIYLMDSLARVGSLDSSSNPVRLWRRRFLERDELKYFIAPSLLGFTMSFEKLVALNAYIIAYWIWLIKLNQA